MDGKRIDAGRSTSSHIPVAEIDGRSAMAECDGDGDCSLAVERGKIVLAAFGHGGTLLPGFALWLIGGTEPTHAAWLFKKTVLAPICWKVMLRGREWMTRPVKLETNA